ncbi:hypothetical protein D3C72_416490 [compost metagenome]
MLRAVLLAAFTIGGVTLAALPASAAVDAQVIIQPRIVIGNPKPVVEKRVVVVERERPVVRERVVIIDKHPHRKYKNAHKRGHGYYDHRYDHRGHHHGDQVVVIRR